MNESMSIPMIKRVEIEGYRSIRKVEVDLAPVTVLIGKSGSGKSNFCHAIRFIRNLVAHDIQKAVDIEKGWERILPVWGRDKGFKSKVIFNLGSGDDYEYYLHFAPVQSQPGTCAFNEEMLKYGGRTLFDRNAGKWITPPPSIGVTSLNPGQLAIRNLPSVSEVVYAYTALSTGLSYHYFRSDVLAMQKGNGGNTEFGLSDDAANFRSVLVDLNRNLSHRPLKERLLRCLQALNASIQSVEPDSIQNPDKVTVAHKSGDTLIPIDLMVESDGLRRYLATSAGSLSNAREDDACSRGTGECDLSSGSGRVGKGIPHGSAG